MKKPRPLTSRRNDGEYVKRRDALRRKARKHNLPCHLCGNRFDWTLDYRHPMAFTADHIDPVGTGGSMTGELAPAHRSCNSRRQTKPLTEVKKPRIPKRSLAWTLADRTPK